MQNFTLRIKARGSLLIGGGNVPYGLHGAHAETGDGRPVIPATALRGAMRETLEALLRGVGRPACEAGSGHEAGQLTTDEPSTEACILDGGGPCTACLLFGGTRDKIAPGSRDFSSLVLGDGEISEIAGGSSWMIRPGVTIDRRHRSAAEKGLFLCRTTATGATFIAKGRLRDQRFKKEFEAAVRATNHIGSGRSSGTARVDIEIDWQDSAESEHETLPDTDLLVQVTLRTPTIFGIPIAHSNLRDTRQEIPGAALRGAVGFALAQELEDPDGDPGFTSLVDEERGAHFGFLSPVMDGVSSNKAPTGHLPLTAHACKVAGLDHGLYDDLFDRIATALIDKAEQAHHVQQNLLAKQCQQCGQPLRSVDRFRQYPGEVPIRSVTRNAIARAPSSCSDGALFTEVYLEPGTVFEGIIRCIPPESSTVLSKVQCLPLQLGRGRGAGHGQVSLELKSTADRPAIIERGNNFDHLLRRHLECCHLPTDRVGRLFSLTFLSPLLLNRVGEDEIVPLTVTLPERLQNSVELVRVRRFVREGSWDQRKGKMHAFQAICAGAVYVFLLPEGMHWRDAAEDLEKIERESIGERRYQGFGEVYAFDPVHLNSTLYKNERTKTMLEIDDPELRKKLVVGAEKVMDKKFENYFIKNWKVEKTQLNQLVNICGEALCVEEIENYLRYQGSRESAPWGLELVKCALAKIGEILNPSMSDKEKVAAWRYFAVYLTRAFTYKNKCNKAKQKEKTGRNGS